MIPVQFANAPVPIEVRERGKSQGSLNYKKKKRSIRNIGKELILQERSLDW